MLRNIPYPLHAARLELDVGIEPSGHGLIDDVLLLLLEQLDQAALVADEPVDFVSLPVEETSDLFLFLQGRKR